MAGCLNVAFVIVSSALSSVSTTELHPCETAPVSH